MLIQSFSVIYLLSASTALPQSRQFNNSIVAHPRDSTHKRRARVIGHTVSACGHAQQVFPWKQSTVCKTTAARAERMALPFLPGNSFKYPTVNSNCIHLHCICYRWSTYSCYYFSRKPGFMFARPSPIRMATPSLPVLGWTLGGSPCP